MKPALVLAMCLLVAAPAFAQQPPKQGMSAWAFWLAEGSEIAAVGTQEIGFAQLGAYDQFVVRRVASGAASIALPMIARWLLHKAPRADANVEAVVISAYGAWATTQNVRVLLTIARLK